MKIGFIGAGNMAFAMMSGIIAKGLVSADNIIASDHLPKALQNISQKLGVKTTADNAEVVKASDIFILAVKPQYYAGVIEEIAPFVTPAQVVVTIAPGQTIARLESLFNKPVRLVRTMPNTPALVQEGIAALCKNELVTDENMQQVCNIFDSFGKSQIVSEKLMDAVVAVSGSSPAYVFMLIEAMADAAVAEFMPRDQAYLFAAQAVLGSAKMVLESHKHPGELKDMVCSPGGTTIEAVRVLEERGFRSAVIEAMKACANRAREL
jgi:pyrroline-5-carboxylate reductase